MLLSDGVMRPVTVLSYVVQLGQFKLETRTALKKTELLFKVGELVGIGEISVSIGRGGFCGDYWRRPEDDQSGQLFERLRE